MTFPDNLKYTKSHEWLRIDGETAFVGITDFAQSELGDIVFVDVSSVGQVLGAGDSYGTIEAVKTVSDLYMPISGEVVEVNQHIIDSPETINSDPYGNGWIARVVIPAGADTSGLMDAAAYQAMVGQH